MLVSNVLCSGYFPLHEDPDNRINRLHPFQVDSNRTTYHHTSNASAPATDYLSSHYHLNLPRSTTHVTNMNVSNTEFSTPVTTSYIPSGVHDTVMPMGKYYPSNYEKRKRQMFRHTSSTNSVGSSGSNAQTPRTDSDAKHRLQQYQRDIMAQTRLVASDTILSTGSPSTSPAAKTAGCPYATASRRLMATALSSAPISPRLLPLGSPGPVTPMTLEEEGDYLNKGHDIPGDKILKSDRRTPERWR